MAKGRMLNKKISNSKRVNDLPIGAELLYTWLIAHLDVNGCFYGDAKRVNHLVFPLKNYGNSQIEKWLVTLEKSVDLGGTPLIYRYKIATETFLWMPGFGEEQVGLRRDKERPEYKTPEKFPTFDGKITEIVRQNDGVIRTAYEYEEESKEELEKEKEKEDVTTISFEEYKTQMRTEFQDLDFDEEFKKFTLYWSEGKRKLKRPKTALCNWLINARKFKQERGPPGNGKKQIDPGDKFINQKYGHMVQR